MMPWGASETGESSRSPRSGAGTAATGCCPTQGPPPGCPVAETMAQPRSGPAWPRGGAGPAAAAAVEGSLTGAAGGRAVSHGAAFVRQPTCPCRRPRTPSGQQRAAARAWGLRSGRPRDRGRGWLEGTAGGRGWGWPVVAAPAARLDWRTQSQGRSMPLVQQQLLLLLQQLACPGSHWP